MYGVGGAIYTRYGSIVASNSTLSGNTAPAGAAIAVRYLRSPVWLRHVTLTNNHAIGYASHRTANNGATLYSPDASVLAIDAVESGGSVDFESTLISGNNAGHGHSIYSCRPTHHNRLEQPAGRNTSRPTVSHLRHAPAVRSASLQPLADNGGPTKTHALGLFSAALDVAETTDTFNLGTDQRGAGFARLFGGSRYWRFRSADQAVACGSASGSTTTFASWFAPASNLCTSGSGASAVTPSSGQWQWTCTGTAFGSPSPFSCSAPIRPPQATLAALDGGTSADLSFNSKFGEAVLLKATLTGDGTTTPAGFATFCSGGTPNPANVTAPCGTGTAVCSNVLLSAAGTATCAVPASNLTVGSLPFSVAFYSDSSYADATATGTLQVSAANTTTAISSEAPSPAVLGAPVTVSVQVAPVLPGAGTPTGVVTINDGSANCSATLSNGVGSCSLTPPASTGSHTIQASYAATTNFAASSTSAALTVNPANTTTTISTVSPSPAVFGAPVTVSVQVAPVLPGAGTPVGVVTVSDGSVNCSATLSNGVGSCSLTPPASTGSHTIQASYAATTNFAASSTSAALTVNPANTTTVISSVSPSPAVLGAPVTVSVRVAPVLPGAGTPTGVVTISDGNVNCGATLSNGVGSCSLTPSASTGSHTIQASYAATTNFAASSTSASLTESPASTTTALSAQPASSVLGQSVVLTAAVQSSTGIAPTGTVAFSEGGLALSGCGGLVVSSGAAICTIASLAVGPHSITATYQPGDTRTISSAGTASVLVDKLTARVGLTSSANPSQQGNWVTFTASVSSVAPASAGPSSATTSGMLVSQGATQASAVATPTGTITFNDGASALGTVSLVNGSATFVTPFTTAGNHTITAAYSGDAATAAANITLVQAVSAADPVVPAPALSTWLLGLLSGLLVMLGLERRRGRL